MAATVQSVATTAWNGSSGIVDFNISKPSGTASGDLLIAHIACTCDAGVTFNILETPPGTDWTLLNFTQLDGGTKAAAQYVFYRVAGGSEPATWSFRKQSPSGGNVNIASAVYRISGQGGVLSVQYSGGTDNSSTTTPSISNSVTPSFANSLLLLLTTSQGTAASGSVSSQAIATNNPTWTEQYDLFGAYTGDSDGVMSGSSATRTETTATGNTSFTTTTGFNEIHIAALVVIPEQVSVTTTVDAPGVITLSGNDHTVVLDYITTVDAPGIVTLNGNDQTVTAQQKTVWTNETKPSTTWTNEAL